MAKKKKPAENSLVKVKGLFDHINHIREGRDPKYFDTLSEADKKTWSTFMVIKALSMQPEIIESVNEIQKYWELQPEQFYQLCLAIVPPGRCWSTWIKKKKEDTYTKELIDIMRRHFQESSRNVIEYLSLMSKKQIRSIVKMYGYTDEETDTIISS